MQRIKYIKINNCLRAIIYDIYARKVEIYIVQGTSINCKIDRAQFSDYLIDAKTINFSLKSLQNAKRKVRKILKEEFEVNLGDEVRSKLCI